MDRRQLGQPLEYRRILIAAAHIAEVQDQPATLEHRQCLVAQRAVGIDDHTGRGIKVETFSVNTTPMVTPNH